MDDIVMEIEVAGKTDVVEIHALQRLAYQSEAVLYDDWTLPPLVETEEETATRFVEGTVLKAVEENRIIGSVSAIMADGACRIGRLIVHPDRQNRGIGTLLLREIEKRFADADRFELFTGHRSEKSLRLYIRCGYRPVREERVTDRLTLIHLSKPGGSAG